MRTINLKSIRLLAVTAIFCLGTVVYSNAFKGAFQFDDNIYIVGNPDIRTFHHLLENWASYPCRFVVFLSLSLNYHFNGLHVFGYHLFNLVVHLLSAFFVWWFVLLTLSTPAMKRNTITPHADLIALLAGLIFVSHPLQTEAVTYMWQRCASMAALFYLASLCFYIKSRLPASSRARNIYYTGSFLMAVVAMFTKENTITLPFMIVLYEISFFEVKKINWKQLSPFLLALLIIPLTIFLAHAPQFQAIREFEKSPEAISPWHYLLTQFRVIVTYTRLLLVPINQNIDYDYAISRNILELPTLISFLFLAGIFYTAIRLFANWRLLSFSILWFFLTLSLESSLFPLKCVIFEHRLYLPMVGYSLFLVSGLYDGARLLCHSEHNKKSKGTLEFSLGITISVLAMIITLNSIATYARNKLWKDPITLWSDTLQKSPYKSRVSYNLGLAYYNTNNWPLAIHYFGRAIAIKPTMTDAAYNLGLAYYKAGDFPESVLAYDKTIDIDPSFVNAYINRADSYYMERKIPEALADLNRALVINPHIAEAYFTRADIYVKLNKLSQAMSDYNKAIEINPDF